MSENNQTLNTTNASTAEFVPPRHWTRLEELDSKYWSDSKEQEARGQEFLHKPIETIAKIDREDQSGLARREFLTLMGAATALASLSCARRPVHKIIPYVSKPEEVTPGMASWYASTIVAPSGMSYGILVKTREGRPIKLEGNPEHPVNKGKLDVRSQAAILDLYDPERLRGPAKIERGTGRTTPLNWSDADQKIAPEIAKALAQGSLRFVSGERLGPSTRRLVGETLQGVEPIIYDPLALDSVIEGQAESYGQAMVPTYRFQQADVILSLGADFLATWGSSVENASQWAERRRLHDKKGDAASMSKFYCVESQMSVTGANADERFGVRPGDEFKIAMAVAHELVVRQGRTSFSGSSGITSKLEGYSPKKVCDEIGGTITEGKIKEMAQALWNARGKSVVVAGGASAQTENALALQVVVNFLNSALENDGRTVRGGALAQGFQSAAQMETLAQDLKSGKVKVLVLYRTNPCFTLPLLASGSFSDAMKSAALIVTIADRVDETGIHSDYVLADHHFLENWGDARIGDGFYSLQQPTIAPLYETRSVQDTLLTWCKAGVKGSGLALSLATTDSTWHEYLRQNWKTSVFLRFGGAQPFEGFWQKSLQKGVVGNLGDGTGVRGFSASAFSSVPAYKASELPKEERLLALTTSVGLGDGRQGNNSWLYELPDPISTCTWDNHLSVSPKAAEELKLRQDDVVEVSTSYAKVELPVFIQPGLHVNAVTVAYGFGRRNAGTVGFEAGVDVFPLARMNQGRVVTAGIAVKLRKTGRRFELAITQGHHSAENRPIINDITLAQFKQNPKAEAHTNPHMRMPDPITLWPVHKYDKPYRWGMAVDLNSCTGCGACVIACQAENNIPVVGRKLIRMSREMHWIRIDRYYSGNPENPQVVFQPMMCQHCENASCETVCPVLATVHSDEGLNEMAYNRCVGTRYCQNNCPYKVRRFNWFDHWKDYKDAKNLAWNPDVTVRSRGVMEKCSFCVQRIQSARIIAKGEDRMMGDADLQTACQQTCPTDAIVFGNINDPKSKVSQIKEDARAFRVLEILNNKPVVSYLTKVRNREASAEHHDNHQKAPPTGHESGEGAHS